MDAKRAWFLVGAFLLGMILGGCRSPQEPNDCTTDWECEVAVDCMNEVGEFITCN